MKRTILLLALMSALGIPAMAQVKSPSSDMGTVRPGSSVDLNQVQYRDRNQNNQNTLQQQGRQDGSGFGNRTSSRASGTTSSVRQDTMPRRRDTMRTPNPLPVPTPSPTPMPRDTMRR